MLCSCGFFSIKSQLSRTDLKNCFSSGQHGVTVGRTILELDALGILWPRMSREWRRALEILRVMISKGHFLARRDTSGNQVLFFLYGVICNEKAVSKSLREDNALFGFD